MITELFQVTAVPSPFDRGIEGNNNYQILTFFEPASKSLNPFTFQSVYCCDNWTLGLKYRCFILKKNLLTRYESIPRIDSVLKRKAAAKAFS